MKKLKLFILLLLIIITACSSPVDEKPLQLVSFDTAIDCDGCKNKIMDSLPKEEGIIDVNVQKKSN